VVLMPVISASKLGDPLLESVAVGVHEVLSEEAFKRMIAIERKRTERSREPFLLMLLEAGHRPGSELNRRALDRVVSALLTSIRETDIIGWYNDRTAVGVMYTGLPVKDKKPVINIILSKVSATLRNELLLEQFNQVTISFHIFPDDWDNHDSGDPTDRVLYPDLLTIDRRKKPALALKRVLDIVGSAIILTICAPLFLIIALAIKATSKGPVLFKQQRVGQYGRCFTFLKFRSMHVNSDTSAHEEFITQFITDRGEHRPPSGSGDGMYKLTNDRRVTMLGKILRRSSLDELPQFLNVLMGDMSMVGPRPPIPYEVAVYQTWHRRRVLEVKPGITGLWQVTGRSRTKFDEMVRLDLRYAESWTLWRDIKILLRTPLAVIKGAGAY